MQAVGTKNRTSLHSIDGSAFKTRGSLSIGRGGHVRKRRRGSLSFGISTTYLMLAAENEGLATLWVGSFDPAGLADILPGTEGYELVAMINVGYPAEASAPSAMHGIRIPIGEFVTRVD